jgi:tetratricopeptide (TPR) repeat protein
LILYAEFQFGNRIPGKGYRERSNGERIVNWQVEISRLVQMYNRLLETYESDSVIVGNDFSFPYLKKIIDLLEPWHVYINLDTPLKPLSASKLGDMETNFILTLLSVAERKIGIIYQFRSQFDLAQKYFQRALSNARLFNVEKEPDTGNMATELEFPALKVCSDLHARQGNVHKALAFAEEAYNCVAMAHDPVHPEVLDAANTLIGCCINSGNLYNAERFAEATLNSLKDKKNGSDQLSDEVATGYYDLASVTFALKVDIVKAEMLARESLRIRNLCNRNKKDHSIGMSAALLGTILEHQGNLGGETLDLLELFLAIDIENYGPEGTDTAMSHLFLGHFYQKKADQFILKGHADEGKGLLQLAESSPNRLGSGLGGCRISVTDDEGERIFVLITYAFGWDCVYLCVYRLSLWLD